MADAMSLLSDSARKAMLEDYRSRVRSVECPACWVPAGEQCMKIGTVETVAYVHDDRSHVYEITKNAWH
jgi:hypothetical protein